MEILRQRAPAPHREVLVGGLKTACLSRSELMSLMVEQCLAKRMTPSLGAKLVFAVNGHTLSLAAKDDQFRGCHDFADIIHADGQPIVFASKVLTELADPGAQRHDGFLPRRRDRRARPWIALLSSGRDRRGECALRGGDDQTLSRS